MAAPQGPVRNLSPGTGWRRFDPRDPALQPYISRMNIASLTRRAPTASLAVLAALLLAREAPAQTRPALPRAAPTARVVLLPVALYNAQANVQEASDTSQATLSTEILTGKLRELLGSQLLAGPRVTEVAASPNAQATTGKQPCNVIVACARTVADSLDAPWVVTAKVSKTSNLIWLFTGQLIHAPTGEIVLDDSTELKGETEAMVRAGSRIFAERVARTVRNGGVANDFPNMP
jgi:hypothetical protein